jgi:hypothetical protein
MSIFQYLFGNGGLFTLSRPTEENYFFLEVLHKVGGNSSLHGVPHD